MSPFRRRHFLALAALILLSPFLSWAVLAMLGYYVNEPGWAVAEKLVEKGRSVDECRKIIVMPWNMLGPPTTEQRMLCRYTYASLTKDPTACELLMPSDYGWSCVGAAEKPNSRACWFDFAPDPPVVGRGDTRVTLPECAGNPPTMAANRCCELARILYLERQRSCETLRDSDVLYDQCLELLARRERNVDLCAGILSDHIRSACEVAVRALLSQ